jgi:putative endonuclease
MRMTSQSRAGDRRRVGLGRGGERLAADWLAAHDVRVIARNWRCPYGEIDLIAEDATGLVFVEVKTRRGERMGLPEEAITPAKRRHMLASAQAYLAEQQREDAPFRIDVLAVQLSPRGTLVAIRHYANAVGEES